MEIIKLESVKEMKKKKRARLKGSITVEASIILPTIIMVLVAMIYIAFFLYDRCIITQKSYILSLRGSECQREYPKYKGTITEFVNSEKEELYNNKLLAVNEWNTKCTIQGTSVTVTTNASIKVPFTVLMNHIGIKNRWSIQEEKESIMINGADFIRKCRNLERLVNKIKNEAGD